MKTLRQLASREAALVAELSEVRAEIAARAGQVDPPKPKPAPRKTAK